MRIPATGEPSTPTRLEALLEAGEGILNPPAEEEARSLGPDRAGAIVAAILEAELASTGGGYTPVAAARLAGDLRFAAAVPALLACVEELDTEDPLREASLGAVEAIGAPALEGALAAFASCRNPDGRLRLGEVLARLQVRDDRVLDALLRNLDDDTVLAAANLAEYGDPRALPRLLAAFDAAPVDDPDEPSITSNEDVAELAATIEELGGALSPERRAKLDRALVPREEFRRLFARAVRLASDEIGVPRLPARRGGRPGRNDPCHCGSGRKYKKCHLASDGG